MARIIPVAMIGILLALAGCEKKVTEENFDKIQVGMSLAEVQIFMGDGRLEEASGTSLGIGGLPEPSSDDLDNRTYAWEEGYKIITVRIVDDKVTSKRKHGTW